MKILIEIDLNGLGRLQGEALEKYRELCAEAGPGLGIKTKRYYYAMALERQIKGRDAVRSRYAWVVSRRTPIKRMIRS